MTNFHVDEANCRLKKMSFFKFANSQYFLWKSTGLVLGLVGLNDAKGIDLAQLYGREAVRQKCQKWPKNTKKAFFDCFRADVGQPHGHIVWAKANPLNFHKEKSRIGDFLKWPFFESAILNFFFASSQWKLFNIYRTARIALVSSSKQHLPKLMAEIEKLLKDYIFSKSFLSDGFWVQKSCQK